MESAFDPASPNCMFTPAYLLCVLYFGTELTFRIIQDTLPASVGALAEAEYRIASTIAITVRDYKHWISLTDKSRIFSFLGIILVVQAALFAGILMSLAQMVLNTDNSSAAWETLRFFVYSAISSNLVAAGCCLWTIYALSDLPYKAQKLAMTDKQSWAYRAGTGESFGNEISHPRVLLKDFGADDYWWQAFGAALWYMLGLLLTFLALITWMWTSQSTAVAAAVTVMTIPGVVWLVYPIAEDFYEGWLA
jgi:hypothetical protein